MIPERFERNHEPVSFISSISRVHFREDYPALFKSNKRSHAASYSLSSSGPSGLIERITTFPLSLSRRNQSSNICGRDNSGVS